MSRGKSSRPGKKAARKPQAAGDEAARRESDPASGREALPPSEPTPLPGPRPEPPDEPAGGAEAAASAAEVCDDETRLDAEGEPVGAAADGSSPGAGGRRTARGTLVMDEPERTSEPSSPSRTTRSRRGKSGTVLMDEGAARGRGPGTSGPFRVTPPGGTRRSRTTLFEVSAIAQRLSLAAPRVVAPTIGKQLVVSLLISVTVVLLATMIFVGGTGRGVLGVLAAVSATTLAVWELLRELPRIAKWLGPRELPGRAWMWLGGAVLAVATLTVLLVVTLSAATTSLVVFGVPSVSVAEGPTASATATAAPGHADRAVKRGGRAGFADGVLYVSKSFSAPDGRFDLLVHYHGNVELVQQSVDAVGLNALVYIVNFGEGSGQYARPLGSPDAFDNLLDAMERRAADKLHLIQPRVRRVALSSWSAGYGAVYQIIRSRSRRARIDALLLMDSLHGTFAPGSETKVAGIKLRPFVAFARRAIAGEKLMVVTHSAVQTHGYPSTTMSADALLERLGLSREKTDPEKASPPPVEIEVARRAFPSGQRNWLRVESAVHAGLFHLLGCRGNDKGDHVAQLAQMSVTVLPALLVRWSKPAGGRR